MSGAAPLHHHGVSARTTLPAYHGDCRFLLGACFLSKLHMLGPLRLSLVCSANPNNHRLRSSDITRPQNGGSSWWKSNTYEEKDDPENIDEFDSDIMPSKNGPPISLTSNSRPKVTSVPGEREEIVELFKRVQSQLRARGKGREEKKPEPAKAHGERGSVDSLLKLLRKHSVDQRRMSSDERERNVDQARRSNDSGNKQNSSVFSMKSGNLEEQKKPHAAPFKRPASKFRRRSPVPGVKFQPVVSANAKSIANNVTDAVQGAKITLDNRTAVDKLDSVSPYEPDSVIPPENLSLDDFDVILANESDASDTCEANGEYLEPSLEIPNVTDIDEARDKSLESFTGGSDISSLKVTELRELAKTRGIKGYSKMMKSELVDVLSNMV